MIIDHMHSDKNTEEHARVALLVTMALLMPLLMLIGFIVGVGIEIIQRLTGGQNTNKESLLDIAGTTLWTWYYYKRMYRS